MCVSEVMCTAIFGGLSLKQRFWGLNNIQIKRVEETQATTWKERRKKTTHTQKKPNTSDKKKTPTHHKAYLSSSFPFLCTTSFSTVLEKQTYGLWETVTRKKFFIQACPADKHLNDSLLCSQKTTKNWSVQKFYVSSYSNKSDFWAQANAFYFLQAMVHC